MTAIHLVLDRQEKIQLSCVWQREESASGSPTFSIYPTPSCLSTVCSTLYRTFPFPLHKRVHQVCGRDKQNVSERQGQSRQRKRRSGLGFVAQQVVIPISKFALMRALTLSVTGIYNKSTPLTHPLQISTRLPSFLHRFFHISQNLLTMSTNAQYNLLNFSKATRKLSSWKVFYISHTKHLHRSLLVVFDEVIETAETAKEIP